MTDGLMFQPLLLDDGYGLVDFDVYCVPGAFYAQFFWCIAYDAIYSQAVEHSVPVHLFNLHAQIDGNPFRLCWSRILVIGFYLSGGAGVDLISFQDYIVEVPQVIQTLRHNLSETLLEVYSENLQKNSILSMLAQCNMCLLKIR